MPPVGSLSQMAPGGGFPQMPPQFPPGTYPVQMGFPMMPPPTGAPGVGVTMDGSKQQLPPQQFVLPMSSQAPAPAFVPPSLAGLSGLPPPPAQSSTPAKPVESSALAASAALQAASSAPTSQPAPPPTTTTSASAPPPPPPTCKIYHFYSLDFYKYITGTISILFVLCTGHEYIIDN